MINGAGLRRIATAIVIALVVGIGLGLRSPDPLRADPPLAAARLRHLAAVASTADGAVLRLSAALAEALDHGRQGAALTVAGDASPAPELISAADRLVAAASAADAVRRSLAEMAGTAASIDPRTEVPALGYDSPELQLIAVQLRDTADAAAVFVERRHATEEIVRALGDALAALDRDEPSAALDSLDQARAPMSLLEAWEERPALLRYWMTITGDLIDAAGQIANATLDGDPSAVAAAAARYAQAATAARGADNALALSLSEGGSAVTGTPLRRLATAAGEAADLHIALQPLVHPAS
jgi:hypothetical protein